ncbi:MAG TPA: trypsin-like peptidase domain-containing protein [Micromonosporaceae bacterium]|nr:trypsin-like peptidase domain-containing protein [Micromonosporaceae bacterium]
MTDGSARWPGPPPGSPPPGHTGALYDAQSRPAGYRPGAPQHVAPPTAPHRGSEPIRPVNAGGPSPSSAWWTGASTSSSVGGSPNGSGHAGAARSGADDPSWWSDAANDPWRDPFAPSAVLVTPPAPADAPEPDVDPPQRRVTFRQVLLISILTALLAGGLGGALGYVAAVRGGVGGGAVLGAGPGAVPSLAQRAPGSLGAAVKAVMPSVVTVRVDGQFSASIGTGFIVSADGYLITNDHVVDGLTGSATIIFSDSTTSTARMVGADVESDIAVLKIDKSGLRPVTFGNSDAIVVGDPVLAIGSPLDLQNTVTYGIVSALHRPLEISDGSGTTRYYSAIQTDAAINHGNSGGPLVDSNGHVIGVNSVIESGGGGGSDPNAGNIGLAFAIPINQAERVANSLISSGKAQHTVIGATVQQVDPTGGVLIRSVVGGGPAEQAGIRAGDVIVEVGGSPITQTGDLTALVRAYAPGDMVSVVYKRAGVRHTVQVKLAATG